MDHETRYLSGFGNHWQSEALPGALPVQNSPQNVPYGLYAEQLSGSAFTRPRSQNFRSWLYRIKPSVCHSQFEPLPHAGLSYPSQETVFDPNQMRWDPIPYPQQPTDFIDGLTLLLCNGNPLNQSGGAILLYAANANMDTKFVYNADAEWLIIPQEGRLRLTTEMGVLELAPEEIAVIPRGVKFNVELLDKKARGYLCENYGSPFTLPDLGPIGANGLANPKDFQIPCAHYDDSDKEHQLLCKFNQRLWQTTIDHAPCNVVAWQGNFAPYKYNLNLFNTINTVSFDHPDPSIFTVLTSPTQHPGIANIDFVIFPERWMVAENTFRPPYFHRNIMSEYMGLIKGEYDAKAEGFIPGGGSLHNAMIAHGPDQGTVEKALQADLKPEKQTGTLAFMLETQLPWQPSQIALEGKFRQKQYQDCWKGLKSYFDPSKRS